MAETWHVIAERMLQDKQTPCRHHPDWCSCIAAQMAGFAAELAAYVHIQRQKQGDTADEADAFLDRYWEESARG